MSVKGVFKTILGVKNSILGLITPTFSLFSVYFSLNENDYTDFRSNFLGSRCN